MRAFLQRAEVRMSTMHRIATAFIGGAGLLLLIPTFLRDVIDTIITILLKQIGNQFAHLGDLSAVLTLVLFGLTAYPLLLSLWVPLYALYLILKDMVVFYFSIYAPNFNPALRHPTFSLNALAFSPDESPRAKEAIMRYQYDPAHVQFTIPFSEAKRVAYFDELINETQGNILPSTRAYDALLAQGIVSPEQPRQEIDRYNAAMGVARALDRQLVAEVAHTEMLMIRNVIFLRRLVLRYVKALLMFIWTTIIAFAMLPFLQDRRLPPFLILTTGYFIWSLAVLRVMHLPVYWVYKHLGNGLDHEQVDRQLLVLEEAVTPYCQASKFVAAAGVLLSLWLWAS